MCELVMFHANRRGEIMAGKIHLQSQDTVETMALPRCGMQPSSLDAIHPAIPWHRDIRLLAPPNYNTQQPIHPTRNFTRKLNSIQSNSAENSPRSD